MYKAKRRTLQLNAQLAQTLTEKGVEAKSGETTTDLVTKVKSIAVGTSKEEQVKSVTITENGTYNVLPDENKVLSEVIADVNIMSGDIYGVLKAAVTGTLTEFYMSENWEFGNHNFGYLFNDQDNLIKWAMPNNTRDLGGYLFRTCGKLKYVDIGKTSSCHTSLFYGKPLKGMTIIIRSETPPNLSGTFTGTSFDDTTNFFVPKNSLEAYKTATNWSVYADCFKAIEDYPEEVNYDNY